MRPLPALLALLACAASVGRCSCEGRRPGALADLRELYRDCFAGGAARRAEECVGGKAARALDELLGAERVPLARGLQLVAARGEPDAAPPESARADGAFALVADRLWRLARSRRLSLSVPAVAAEFRGTGLQKIRKMLLPFLIGVVLKFIAFLPLMLSFMGVVAMNALGASKIAMLATGLVALRRLLGSTGLGGGAGGGLSHGGLQLEKSYGLLNAAPSITVDYSTSPHELYPAHAAAYAPHPAFYGRALQAALHAVQASQTTPPQKQYAPASNFPAAAVPAAA